LSSVSAEKALILQNVKTGHNKGRIDETAAAIVLQQYLDRSR
jgi:putative Holliday junction resolvase